MILTPQDQATYYNLQNRQAIAQALMGQSLENQASQIPTNMPVMPKYSIGAGLTQLGKAYLAAKLQQGVGQGYADLGQQQMAALVGTPTQATAQQQPQTGTTPNSFAGDQGGSATTGSGAPYAFDSASSGDVGGSAAGSSAAGAPTPLAAAPISYQGGLLSPGSVMNPSGMDPTTAAFFYRQLGPEEYSRQYVAPYVKPTDATLAGRQAGYTPQQIQQANAGRIFKDNFVAPVTGTGIFRDPRTMQPVANNPEIQKGAEPIFNAGGQVIGQRLLDGTLTAIRQARAAEELGAGSALPAQPQYDAQGNPLPTMSRTASIAGGGTGGPPLPLRNNNPGAVSPGGSVAQYPDMQTGVKAMDDNLASYAGKQDAKTLGQVITKWVGSPDNAPAYIKDVTSRLGIGANTPVDLTNPAQRLAISSAIMLHENGSAAVFAGGNGSAPKTPAQGGSNYPVQVPGVVANANAAATNQQGELSTKWKDLTSQNQQAQSVISNLQNIKALAAKANLGQMGDKLAYANSLLALAGSQKAQDAVTANNLLDKYSNQIVARLGGQGGMGTDAARSILESAYPGRHMDQTAISEASDNLVGAQQMTQAKAKLLAPYRNKNDATGYTNTELAFDQNADPRIWQLQGMNADQQKAYVSNMPQDVAAQLLKQRQALKGMGAL